VKNSLCLTLTALLFSAAPAFAADPSTEEVLDATGDTLVLRAGHPSLAKWLLPEVVPSPADNRLTPERVALGKQLFFDARLSGTGQSTCASCHAPERGWGDGFPKSVRFMGAVMTRASPSLVNIGYNTIFQWDGRSPTIEHQAVGGAGPSGSMNAGPAKPTDGNANIAKLRGYVEAFERAYPGEGVTPQTIAKAISSFERTIVSRDSPFDQWVRGKTDALTPQQVRGFRVFVDPAKGNCAACHAAPNFTDNGFHNLGLKSFADEKPDVGRFAQRPVAVMQGAFKTPQLRDIAQTAPYFHDGSARTLPEVVEHYAKGGEVRTNLSPNMKALSLTAEEKEALVAFMRGLSTQYPVFVYPMLPKD
jgi:cytochrome c peroxidase